MEKTILLLLFSFILSATFAQSKLLISLPMKSKLLDTDVKYSVYLPHGFEDAKKEYPVVYLLNGYTGDETDWVRIGHVKDIADELDLGSPDALDSYETLKAAIEANYPRDVVDTILSSFANNRQIQDMGLPPELERYLK